MALSRFDNMKYFYKIKNEATFSELYVRKLPNPTIDQHWPACDAAGTPPVWNIL
jgi:hypothetical protein